MNRTHRGLLLVSFEKDDINRVLNIVKMDKKTDFDLLYVYEMYGRKSDDFPQDAVYELYRRASNIVGCYVCDGHEVREFVKNRSKVYVYEYRCQYFLLAINLILGKCIEGKYDRIIYCSPNIDHRFYQIPAEMTLGDAEFVTWQYPITDYGITSGAKKRSCCDFSSYIDSDLIMSVEQMKDFCSGMIELGILDRLVMEEAELLPF